MLGKSKLAEHSPHQTFPLYGTYTETYYTISLLWYSCYCTQSDQSYMYKPYILCIHTYVPGDIFTTCHFLIASFQEQHNLLKPSMIITYILVVPVTQLFTPYGKMFLILLTHKFCQPTCGLCGEHTGLSPTNFRTIVRIQHGLPHSLMIPHCTL